MELFYRSTRNENIMLTASEAILKGLSDEGGLFVPEYIPKLPVPLANLAGMDSQETAYVVMKQFLTDFTEEELRGCIRAAYDDKFDNEEIAPIAKSIIWNCSTVQRSRSKIWRFPFCRT